MRPTHREPEPDAVLRLFNERHVDLLRELQKICSKKTRRKSRDATHRQ